MNDFEFLRHFLKMAWALLKHRPLSFASLLRGLKDIRNLLTSWAAMKARQLGVRAIVAVGVCASLYAGYLFLSDQLAQDAPKASQDAILKARWASPKPSQSIVIVDIDERTLATLAPQHGRWPWQRSVLADGLDRVVQAGARAVLFNIVLVDPDKTHPDEDSAMEALAAMTTNVAYPLVRLNPENDDRSQLKVSDLLARTGDHPVVPDKTVAVLLPMFQSMWGRIGIANQRADNDGIVRRYPVVWSDARLTMPSIVGRTAMLGGADLGAVPQAITLNWRNKSSRYTRISFSDLLGAVPDAALLQAVKGAYVVLGVSAPGLGMTKPTAVAPLEDDNEILATALDDVLSGTHIKLMPAWLVLLIQLVTIWTLVGVGIGRSLGSVFNKAFVIAQSGAAYITIASASYTSYLIDFSSSMAFGAGVFAAIKLVKSLDAGWSRAKPGLRALASTHSGGAVLLIGYRDRQVEPLMSAQLQRLLEGVVGLQRVIRVDDLFGGESFARTVCEDYSCQFCLTEPHKLPELLAGLRELSFSDYLDIRELELGVAWNPEAESFKRFVAPTLLRQCANLMEEPTISQAGGLAAKRQDVIS